MIEYLYDEKGVIFLLKSISIIFSIILLSLSPSLSAVTWTRAFSAGGGGGKVTEALGHTDWPDNMRCYYGSNIYHIFAYSSVGGSYTVYYGLSNAVGVRVDHVTEVITNVGYCANLNGLTLSQAIAAGDAW